METDEERAEETEAEENGCEGFWKIVGYSDVRLRRNYFENVITGMCPSQTNLLLTLYREIAVRSHCDDWL